MCRFLCALWAALLFILGAGAGRAPAQVVYDRSGRIADLEYLPQKASAYLNGNGEKRLLDEAAQAEQTAALVKKFFSPWDDEWPQEHVKTFFSWDLTKEKFYGGTLLPITQERMRELLDLGDLEHLPSRSLRAIATANADLRFLPTPEPLFDDPDSAGEGWPFDYSQNSTMWSGTPLRVLHESRDGMWLFCVSNFAAGWVRAADVAFVSDDLAAAWRSLPLHAITVDYAPLRDAAGRTLAMGRLGALFPKRNQALLVPLRNEHGKAVPAEATAPEDATAALPIELTAGNLAAVADRLMGTPYGWGGLLDGRDCSAMMRDLLAPFGLWLPRNSKPQARESGAFVELSGMSDEEKLQAIRAHGVPFGSLIGMKGHIGLYLGYDETGEPLLLHNLWGVGIKSDEDPELSGRVLIGRAAVTTLHTGCERPDVAPRGRVPSIITLTMLPGLPVPSAEHNKQKPLALSPASAKIEPKGGSSAEDQILRRNLPMQERKNIVTMKGSPLTLIGPELKVGDKAPDFCALDTNMAPKTLKDYAGKIKVFSVAPSLDTPVCDLQATWFNEDADKLGDVYVLNFTMDLPFALKRYCAAKGFDKVDTLSDHRDASFGTAYGMLIKELRLLARGVFVVDRDDVIRYIEIVPEATNSINFDKLLEVVTELAK